MKSFLLALVGALFVNTAVFSQSDNIINLSNKVTKGATSDSLKVRAIFEWVIDNVSYDVKLLKKIGRKPVEQFAKLQEADKVVKAKKAVCMGYAQLFRDLCLAQGIECEMVTGYSKKIHPQTGKHRVSESLHAWNSVRIKGNWYLVDPTWGAGGVSESGKFEKKRNEEFYLGDGNVFIKRHLPFDPMWQLLEFPLSVKEFNTYKEWPLSREEVKPFMFLDSLDQYIKLNPKDRKLASYARGVVFDPNNDEAKLALGNNYNQTAIDAMNKNNSLYQYLASISNKEQAKEALSHKDEFFVNLNIAETSLQKAKYYYNMIPRNSRFGPTASNNKIGVAKALSMVSKQRGSLSKTFKSLELKMGK